MTTVYVLLGVILILLCIIWGTILNLEDKILNIRDDQRKELENTAGSLKYWIRGVILEENKNLVKEMKKVEGSKTEDTTPSKPTRTRTKKNP